VALPQHQLGGVLDRHDALVSEMKLESTLSSVVLPDRWPADTHDVQAGTPTASS
jgi:hypothetical protein